MLVLYSLMSIISFPILLIYLLIRIAMGKEDYTRINERLGFSFSKVSSINKVIWIHAASVGESYIALNIINNLQQDLSNYHFLITTCTQTSAKLLQNMLPNNTTHQFVPIDTYFSVKNFLKTWNPTIGIFIESEIWPNLLYFSAKNFPIMLLNARISDASYKKWLHFTKFSCKLLNRFSIIATQSIYDFKKYRSLGAKNIINLGNFKFANPIPIVNQQKLSYLYNQIHGRMVVVGVSTHIDDEEMLYKAYVNLKSTFPCLLLIIVPRHPQRVNNIVKAIKTYNIIAITDSSKNPITDHIDCYIVDSIGESGTFLSLASITFIGGSITNGGHNPIEAAYFKTVIIFGPDMSNFKSVAEEFIQNKAAVQINNDQELLNTIKFLLSSLELRKHYYLNSQKILQSNKDIARKYVEQIKNYI